MNRKLKRPKKLVGRSASYRSAFLSPPIKDGTSGAEDLGRSGRALGLRAARMGTAFLRPSAASAQRGHLIGRPHRPRRRRGRRASSPKAKRRKAKHQALRQEDFRTIPYRRPSAASLRPSGAKSRWEGPSSITIAGKHKATCQQKGGASSSRKRRAGTLHWGHLQA